MARRQRARKPVSVKEAGAVPAPGLGAAVRQSGPVAAAEIPPAMLAVLLTAVLCILVLGILRPGYWINDDLKIAWLLSGYPGVDVPSPFPNHSNVLVGLALLPFFQYAGSLNWYSILTTTTTALSMAGLLYLVAARTRRRLLRLIGCLMILVGMAPFVAEISYTISSFMAALTGICLVWAGTRHPNMSRLEATAGIGLIVLGSLIRLQMVEVAAAIAVLPLLVLPAKRRLFALALTAACIVVLAGYGFSRLYVRANPGWNAFFAHTQVRQEIHDTHRLSNVHRQIRRIGWTANDQELFARWFYPDEELYSYERLRYLQDHVSPYSQNLGATLAAWLSSMIGRRNLPFLILALGMILGAGGLRLRFRPVIALISPVLIALIVNAGFAVAYKDPDYVQASTLAGSVLMATVVLSRELEQRPTPAGRALARRFFLHRALGLAGLGAVAIGVMILLGNLLATSRSNAQQRKDYERIRVELQALQNNGTLPRNALIISPAHGLPFEWSDPFMLDRPDPAYLDTGWITFSPSYAETLELFGIRSVPEALLHREDVFLMTQDDFTPFLAQYYVEHHAVTVEFEVLYRMPNPSQWPGYNGICLYRVREV